MEQRDDAAVRDFVERMALVWADWGFPKMAARVLMTFMASNEEVLTAARLREILDASAGAISGAVRYLIQIQMLRRHPLPGSREHAYSLYEDTWYQVTAKGGFYAVLATLTQDGVKAAGPDTPGGRRLADMQDFFLFLDSELSTIVARWHAQRDTAEGP
ncbi:MarR family transcriptional regulator [Actinocorallia aurea]